MTQLTAGHLAILQGLRKIKEMAKANVIGAFAGLCVIVPVYWIWGLQGIVPGMIIMAAIALLIAIYYSRKIKLTPAWLSFKETYLEGRMMVKLGFFTVIASFIELATMYLTRGFVANKIGLVPMGQFIAAWGISTTYLSVVLGAMGADFFPRLSGVTNDRPAANKLINEQMEIALLITCPLIIGILSFIHPVVTVFYSREFTETSGILYWQLIGDFFKIITWCLMFGLLAKNKGLLYILITILWSLLYLAGIFLGWNSKGLEITGMAFAAAYFLSTTVSLVVAGKTLQFRLSEKTVKYIGMFSLLIFITYLSNNFLEGSIKLISSLALSAVTIFFSFTQLKSLVDLSRIFKFLKKKNN